LDKGQLDKGQLDKGQLDKGQLDKLQLDKWPLLYFWCTTALQTIIVLGQKVLN